MGGWLSRSQVDAAVPETPGSVRDGCREAALPSMRLETQFLGARHPLLARVLPRAAIF